MVRTKFNSPFQTLCIYVQCTSNIKHQTAVFFNEFEDLLCIGLDYRTECLEFQHLLCIGLDYRTGRLEVQHLLCIGLDYRTGRCVSVWTIEPGVWRFSTYCVLVRIDLRGRDRIII